MPHPSLALREWYQSGKRALKATCLDVGIDAWCNAKFLQLLFTLLHQNQWLRDKYQRTVSIGAGL